jgi:hypothetical protein
MAKNKGGTTYKQAFYAKYKLEREVKKTEQTGIGPLGRQRTVVPPKKNV